MTDRHTLNAIRTSIDRWQADPLYDDAEALADIVAILVRLPTEPANPANVNAADLGLPTGLP